MPKKNVKKKEQKKKPAWAGFALNKEEQHNLKKNALLKAAAKMFSENGFHKTSLTDLADQLNVTKPTIYYYFHDKKTIYEECLKIGANNLFNVIDEAEKSQMSPKEKLIYLIEKYINEMTTDFGKCVVLGLPESPEDRISVVDSLGRIDQYVRELITEGCKAGDFRKLDPKITSFAIFGALNGIARWHKSTGELDIKEITEKYVDVIINGLT